MGTITALGLLLLIAMVVVGGGQGLQAWLSLLFNFGALFFCDGVNGVSFLTGTGDADYRCYGACHDHLSRGNDSNSTLVAFYASIIVLLLLVVMIIPVEHWAQIQLWPRR